MLDGHYSASSPSPQNTNDDKVNFGKQNETATGRLPQGPFVGARLPRDLIDKIDAWAARECDNSRSENIRRLLERALAAVQGAKPRRLVLDEKDRAASRSTREACDALEHSREKTELALAAIARLVERSLASEPDLTSPSQRGQVRK